MYSSATAQIPITVNTFSLACNIRTISIATQKPLLPRPLHSPVLLLLLLLQLFCCVIAAMPTSAAAGSPKLLPWLLCPSAVAPVSSAPIFFITPCFINIRMHDAAPAISSARVSQCVLIITVSSCSCGSSNSLLQ
jgi:hypothetical protein